MAAQQPLLSQLIGTWALVSYATYSTTDPNDVIHILGPNATGQIAYTSDGYMSAHLLRPGQPDWANGDINTALTSATTEEWAQAGKNYHAYCGRYWFDETGGANGEPLLVHEMAIGIVPAQIGLVQRRLMLIEQGDDGEMYLNLGVERFMGQQRDIKVRWKKCKSNAGVKPPKNFT